MLGLLSNLYLLAPFSNPKKKRVSCFIEFFVWFHIVCDRYTSDYAHFTFFPTPFHHFHFHGSGGLILWYYLRLWHMLAKESKEAISRIKRQEWHISYVTYGSYARGFNGDRDKVTNNNFYYGTWDFLEKIFSSFRIFVWCFLDDWLHFECMCVLCVACDLAKRSAMFILKKLIPELLLLFRVG